MSDTMNTPRLIERLKAAADAWEKGFAMVGDMTTIPGPAMLREAASALEAAQREADKSERRAITFGDILAQYVSAMRAAVVDATLNGPEAGMAWIENTLDGPGHLPDVEAAKAEGGAQCMFNREMAEHEAFRAAHPAP